MIMADGRLSRSNQVAGVTYTFLPDSQPKKLKRWLWTPFGGFA
jgi:hypothetical protein